MEIGKIVTVHGIAGELKVYPWCDSPQVMEKIKTLYFDGGKTPVKARCRAHGKMVLCKLEGVDTPEAARRYIERVLWADRGDIKLEEGQYFIADLIGLRAIDADSGKPLGELVDVLPSAAAPLYSIRTPAGEDRLVPAVKQFVGAVDLSAGTIEIKPIKGLLSDED